MTIEKREGWERIEFTTEDAVWVSTTVEAGGCAAPDTLEHLRADVLPTLAVSALPMFRSFGNPELDFRSFVLAYAAGFYEASLRARRYMDPATEEAIVNIGRASIAELNRRRRQSN